MSDIEVVKTGPAKVAPGETVGYPLTVTNRGPDAGMRIENCTTASSDRTILKSAAPQSCTVATIPSQSLPVTG